jgi:hypothetical protein
MCTSWQPDYLACCLRPQARLRSRATTRVDAHVSIEACGWRVMEGLPQVHEGELATTHAIGEADGVQVDSLSDVLPGPSPI